MLESDHFANEIQLKLMKLYIPAPHSNISFYNFHSSGIFSLMEKYVQGFQSWIWESCNQVVVILSCYIFFATLCSFISCYTHFYYIVSPMYFLLHAFLLYIFCYILFATMGSGHISCYTCVSHLFCAAYYSATYLVLNSNGARHRRESLQVLQV